MVNIIIINKIYYYKIDILIKFYKLKSFIHVFKDLYQNLNIGYNI